VTNIKMFLKYEFKTWKTKSRYLL